MNESNKASTSFKFLGIEFSGPPWMALVFIIFCLAVLYLFFTLRNPLQSRSRVEQGIAGERNNRDATLERYINSVAGNAIEIYMREIKDAVVLRFRARADWTQSARIDVNQNHTLDPHIDVSYSNTGSIPCFQYLLDQNTSTTCGAFRSSATVEVLEEPGPWRSTTWTIPKVELSSSGDSVWLNVGAYNVHTKQFIKGLFDKPIKIIFTVE
jgi:hypothetical protein